MLDIPAAKKPNPIDVSVGTRIRMRRKLLCMSQERLAERLGITFQQIQKYEKGTNRVGASRLSQIAEALGTPVAFFFDNDGAVVGNTVMENEMLSFLGSPEGMQLNRAFAQIQSPKARKQILGIVRLVAGMAPSDDSPTEMSVA